MGELTPLPRIPRTERLRRQFEDWLKDNGAAIDAARHPYRIGCWFWCDERGEPRETTLDLETSRPTRRRA